MHLAVVTNYYPDLRQLAEYGLHLVGGLQEARPDCQVTVVSGAPGPPGVWRPWRFDSLALALDLSRALRSLRPDAVLISHSFSSWGDRHPPNFMGFLAIALAARICPTIALIHHLPQTLQVEQTGYRLTLPVRLGIDLACRLLARAHRVIFPLGRDCQYFASHFKAHGTERVELGLPGRVEPQPWPEIPALLTLGVWGPSKALASLLRAAQGLAAELVVAGRSHWRFPSFLSDLQSRYESPQVSFPGYVDEDELPGLFGNCWLVVLPYKENTGASAVLHLACKFGRAVLASDLPVFRSEAERLGLRVNLYRDEADLADQLRTLLGSPERLRDEGLRNAAAMRSIEMRSIGERYWEIVESLRVHESQV